MSAGAASSILLVFFTLAISFGFAGLANWATRRD